MTDDANGTTDLATLTDSSAAGNSRGTSNGGMGANIIDTPVMKFLIENSLF